MWECQILGLAFWKVVAVVVVFPDTGRLPFLVAVANVHSHVLGSWVPSSWLAPALLLVTCENGLSERWDLICRCQFNLHPPVIIRDVQHLILEREMATHSSVLAWGVPWMEEPGRLLSKGLHRVRGN